MRRFFLLGMLAGVAVGAAGMWALRERPWADGGADPGGDAAGDAGVGAAVGKSQGRGKGRGRGRGGGGKGAEPGDAAPVPLSAADLQPVWKGEAVELPPRAVDMEEAGDARALSPAEINRTLRGQSQAMEDCLVRAAGNAEIRAQVTLELLVGGDGRVQKVRARAPVYLFEHGLYACARAAALDLSFPATGAPTVVTAPYDLY